MTIKELIESCEGLSKGDYIIVKRKSLFMKKYGSSKKFRPRTVVYPSICVQFDKVTTDGVAPGYLLTSDGCFYYSKLESVTKKL